MIMQETIDMPQDLVCPKCGSPMETRKIWKMFKSVDVTMCKMCKFYIKTSEVNSSL